MNDNIFSTKFYEVIDTYFANTNNIMSFIKHVFRYLSEINPLVELNHKNDVETQIESMSETDIRETESHTKEKEKETETETQSKKPKIE
jgi:hypothetical protein